MEPFTKAVTYSCNMVNNKVFRNINAVTCYIDFLCCWVESYCYITSSFYIECEVLFVAVTDTNPFFTVVFNDFELIAVADCYVGKYFFVVTVAVCCHYIISASCFSRSPLVTCEFFTTGYEICIAGSRNAHYSYNE